MKGAMLAKKRILLNDTMNAVARIRQVEAEVRKKERLSSRMSKLRAVVVCRGRGLRRRGLAFTLVFCSVQK